MSRIYPEGDDRNPTLSKTRKGWGSLSRRKGEKSTKRWANPPPGDWWDPRTPGNVWNQLNPFNPNASMSNTATSIWDSLSGMATGNWSQVAQSYDRGPYGQIGCQKCKWRTAETVALAGSGAAATAAGGLILLDAAGISNIGNTQIGWKGGEITFTRPGKCTPDFRINPFGDDNWPPHYHRRPGIGKHRPWEGW